MQKTIVFDADDTLWDEQGVLQRFENAVEQRLDALLETKTRFSERFIHTENQNIPQLGYGFASYIFSVGEAIGAEPAWRGLKSKVLEEVRELIESVQFSGPPVIPGVPEVLERLTGDHNYPLVLLTRGVDFEQRFKLVRSGLEKYFSEIRVVQRKDITTYRETAILVGDPSGESLCMVGNSVRSDVNPAIEAGWRAIHVPAATAWSHDHDLLAHSARAHQVQHMGEIVDLVTDPSFWMH